MGLFAECYEAAIFFGKFKVPKIANLRDSLQDLENLSGIKPDDSHYILGFSSKEKRDRFVELKTILVSGKEHQIYSWPRSPMPNVRVIPPKLGIMVDPLKKALGEKLKIQICDAREEILQDLRIKTGNVLLWVEPRDLEKIPEFVTLEDMAFKMETKGKPVQRRDPSHPKKNENPPQQRKEWSEEKKEKMRAKKLRRKERREKKRAEGASESTNLPQASPPEPSSPHESSEPIPTLIPNWPTQDSSMEPLTPQPREKRKKSESPGKNGIGQFFGVVVGATRTFGQAAGFLPRSPSNSPETKKLKGSNFSSSHDSSPIESEDDDDRDN